ncbi:MAG: N-acetyltransferase family protein [Gammaproteobacteria bacterium]
MKLEASVEEFSIRDGQLSDCPVIARFVNESSVGAANYLFANPGQNQVSAEARVSELLASEVHYSYANTVVAQTEGEIIGAALSFPASGLVVNEQIRQYYSTQQFEYIQYFANNKLKDSWHLDAICIDSDYRGNGVGKRLLEAVKQQACYYQFSVLEAFVFASNARAIRFYQRNGFVVCKKIDASNHEFLSDKSPLVLIRCDLPSND